MANINLNAVSLSYPVYQANARSFKKGFLRAATGGSVAKDSNEMITVHALENIHLNIQNGDRIGLTGHNGSGKSTLLRLLAGIYEPSSGTIKIQGKISSLLDLMSGIEDEFTGYENILIRGTMLGLKKKEINARMAEIAEFSELGSYLTMPIRTYSSGMKVRLAFSISTCISPEILLIDEIFGAGDASFMEKAKLKMLDLIQSSNIVILASHNNDLIQEFCNKNLILENGKVKFFG